MFSNLPVNGRLGYFQFLAVTNKTSMNNHTQVLWINAFRSFGYTPKSRIFRLYEKIIIIF